jgi:hypothetical protein
MKARYRVFQRGWGTFYCEDLQTKKQESLRTRDKDEAFRLVAAKNETEQAPGFSLHLARVYWKAGDPAAATRTWQNVMEEIPKLKQGDSQRRWQTAIRDPALDPLRKVVVLETPPEHFLGVLGTGTLSTNVFLRRIHAFAMDMGWLPWPVMPKKRWPKIVYKERRAITWEEHQKIVAGERNVELRAFYELLWHLGGSQTDMATLTAENIDYKARTVAYARRKTASRAVVHYGDTLAALLETRPKTGSIFPKISLWPESDRGKAFIRRCLLVGVSGVCLHSYRYAWAERAKTCGYPERFAQMALGHNSAAVHRAYAKKAQVALPPLEDFEKRMAANAAQSVIVPLPVAAAS